MSGLCFSNENEKSLRKIETHKELETQRGTEREREIHRSRERKRERRRLHSLNLQLTVCKDLRLKRHKLNSGAI